jgi:O-antigen/teichoic acid export membrane protein
MSLRRNAALNLAGHAVPLLTALATIPSIVLLLGEQRYGVLVLGLLLATYFGLAELGLSQAVAQKLASLPKRAFDLMCPTLTTGFWASGVLGLAGGVLAAMLGWIYFSYSSHDAAIATEARAAIAWLVPLVPLSTMGAVLNAKLQAEQRFVALNAVLALGGMALQLAPLVVIVGYGPSLPAAMGAVVAVRAGILVALLALARSERTLAPPTSFDRLEFVRLLRFGKWTTVSSTIGPLMVVLDRFLIGHQLGLKMVPTYAIPFQLAEKTTLLSAALNQALFPQLAAEESPGARERLALRATQTLALTSAPPIAVATLGCESFLHWWLPPDLGAQSIGVARWLLVGFWFNGLALVPLTLLYASGRPAAVARCHLLELVPYLGLLVLAIGQQGVEGAAFAFAARAFVDLLLLAGAASILVRTLAAIALPAIVLLAAFGVASIPWAGSPTGLTVVGVMIAALTAYAWVRISSAR